MKICYSSTFLGRQKYFTCSWKWLHPSWGNRNDYFSTPGRVDVSLHCLQIMFQIHWVWTISEYPVFRKKKIGQKCWIRKKHRFEQNPENWVLSVRRYHKCMSSLKKIMIGGLKIKPKVFRIFFSNRNCFQTKQHCTIGNRLDHIFLGTLDRIFILLSFGIS